MRRHLLSLTLLGGGIALGEMRHSPPGDRRDLVYVLVLVALAMLPAVIVVRLRRILNLTRRLSRGFVLGAFISILAAPALGRITPGGHWYGLTGHKNQLAMVAVGALPLVAVAFSRRPVRWASYGLLALGLLMSGSRSGLLGAGVVAVLIGVAELRSAPRRSGALLGLILLTAPVIIAIASTEQFVAESPSVTRLLDPGETAQSDEYRENLIDSGLSELGVDTAMVGKGYYMDPAPHNAYLEAWVAGGALALAGLVAVFVPVGRSVVLGATGRRTATVSFRLAAGVLGVGVVLLFNNLLWAPYVWSLVALQRWSVVEERSAAHLGRERRQLAQRSGSVGDCRTLR